MSGLSFRRKKRAVIDLNVISLVDILFLLLIFFTLTSTFKRAGELDLQLPESTTAGPGRSQPAHVERAATTATDLEARRALARSPMPRVCSRDHAGRSLVRVVQMARESVVGGRL